MSVLNAALVTNPGLVGALMSGDVTRIGEALSTSILLLPATELGDGQAIARAGRDAEGRRLVWAFSDPEALAAFDRQPAGAAVAISGRDLVLTPGLIAVNAAGPGATMLQGGAREPAPSLAPVGPPGQGASGPSAEELVHIDARAELRRTAREAHERGRAAAVAGPRSARGRRGRSGRRGTGPGDGPPGPRAAQ